MTEKDSKFRIFDYILELENKVEVLVSSGEEKAQAEYKEREMALEEEYDKKIQDMKNDFQNEKQQVEDEIAQEQIAFEEHQAIEIERVREKFTQNKESVIHSIIRKFDLPFLKE
jgi:uncharacterized membrane protein YdbT with pleckstrin-like domain